MKTFIKWVVIILFAAFAGIQFIRPEYSNPPINEPDTLQATTQVPADVEQIFARSCNDCHTNKARYPWYSNIAPLSWNIVGHIDHGRSHLNFSVWNTYDLRKKRKKLDEVCDEMTDGRMPHEQYLWLHREALVSAGDINTICDWTKQESDRLAAQELR